MSEKTTLVISPVLFQLGLKMREKKKEHKVKN